MFWHMNKEHDDVQSFQGRCLWKELLYLYISFHEILPDPYREMFMWKQKMHSIEILEMVRTNCKKTH